MQKNPQENFTTIEIDQVSGEHYLIIPEWILDEQKWYEGTEVNIEVENNCIVITDIEDSWQDIHNAVWFESNYFLLWLKDLQ